MPYTHNSPMILLLPQNATSLSTLSVSYQINQLVHVRRQRRVAVSEEVGRMSYQPAALCIYEGRFPLIILLYSAGTEPFACVNGGLTA